MERRCREAGVIFQPLIFESTGGVSVEADRVLKGLNKAVAENIDASEEAGATQLWQPLGVHLLRGACRAFHRRLVGRGADSGFDWGHFAGLSGLSVAGGG